MRGKPKPWGHPSEPDAPRLYRDHTITRCARLGARGGRRMWWRITLPDGRPYFRCDTLREAEAEVDALIRATEARPSRPLPSPP